MGFVCPNHSGVSAVARDRLQYWGSLGLRIVNMKKFSWLPQVLWIISLNLFHYVNLRKFKVYLNMKWDLCSIHTSQIPCTRLCCRSVRVISQLFTGCITKPIIKMNNSCLHDIMWMLWQREGKINVTMLQQSAPSLVQSSDAETCILSTQSTCQYHVISHYQRGFIRKESLFTWMFVLLKSAENGI